MFDIREPTEADREGIARVVGLSFNFVVDVDDISLTGQLCAFDGPRLVGAAQAISFQQWLGGARVPCAGIASVVVLPEHRGRGVGGALMRDLLVRRSRQGDAVSTLYPANSALYRQLGYEFAGVRPQFRGIVADFPAARGEVRELAEGDLPAVMACYSRWASAHNGPVETSDPERWARHVLAHQGEGTLQRTVVVPGADGLSGYASYFLDAGEPGGYRMTCKHLVALGPAAMRSLLGYFRRFENAAREVAWCGPASSAPVGLALNSSGFSLQTSMLRWMTRVLDVPRALEARGYPAVSGQAVISIDDPLFPANAGPWLITCEEGRVQVTPAGAPATLGRPLPIGLFSALYTGFATTSDLVLMGALDEGDPRLTVLSALFGGPVPWMPDFF